MERINRFKKIIIRIFLIGAVFFVVLVVVGFMIDDKGGSENLPGQDGNSITKNGRLNDPELLYASFSWYGLCSGPEGEDGGCSTEQYLYLNGNLVAKSFWSGGKNETMALPVIEKNIGTILTEEIKTSLRNSKVMEKECKSEFIVDAGWDYQVNLDGAKKFFRNPPDECKKIFDDIDGVIDSVGRS